MVYHGYHSWFMQSHPKIYRMIPLCTGCDKKETGCTRASAADTLDLQQVSEGVTVHGQDQVWANRPDVRKCRSEDEWCIGAYYREMLLTQKLLPVMHRSVSSWLSPATQCSCSLMMRHNQPSGFRHLYSFHHSTDLNPLDYKIRGEMQ